MEDISLEALRRQEIEYGIEKVRIYTKGWTPPWSYSYEDGEKEERTVNITAWDGATRISKKRVGKSLNSVYYDGVRVDVLEENTITPYDLDLRLNCLTYPDILETLVGVSESPGVKYEANNHHKTFGLSYQTRVGDEGYKIHYYPSVKATPTEITYSTMSNSPEPVEFSFDLAVIRPQAYQADGVTALGVTLDTEMLSKSLTDRVEYLLYEDATNIDTLLKEVYAKTNYTPQFFDNGDGTWYALVDDRLSSGFYDLKPVPPKGEEFSISVSQDDNNPQYLDGYTWSLYTNK